MGGEPAEARGEAETVRARGRGRARGAEDSLVNKRGPPPAVRGARRLDQLSRPMGFPFTLTCLMAMLATLTGISLYFQFMQKPKLPPEMDEPCVMPLPRARLALPGPAVAGPADVDAPSPRVLNASRPLNKIAEAEDFYGERWLAPVVEMGYLRAGQCPLSRGAVTDNCLQDVVRKSWEFAQGILALDALGLLHEGSRALGVGSGHERVVFYLARRLGHVTATDLYDRGGWKSREGDPTMLTDPARFAPFPYPTERLSVETMDGSRLRYPDASFDVVFCFSSIEHFYDLRPWGFHAAAERSIREMARVTRKGGAVILATEVILNGAGHYDWVGDWLPMRNFFLPEEVQRVLVQPARSAGLQLVEPIDWSASDLTLQRTVVLGRCGHERPHIVLRQDGVYWTSLSLAFRKL